MRNAAETKDWKEAIAPLFHLDSVAETKDWKEATAPLFHLDSAAETKDWKEAIAPLFHLDSPADIFCCTQIMAQRLNASDAAGAFHFVTLSVRERKKAFVRPQYAQAVLQALRFECDRHPAKLAAYVVMPDHVHFLFEPEDGKATRFLSRFKPRVTLEIDALAAASGRLREREWLAEKGPRELWHYSKHSIPIYSASWMRQKIRYIHFNPVRAGLVQSPEQFCFSSYHAYYPEFGTEPPVKVDLLDL